MRRALSWLAVLLTVAASAEAQIGRHVPIRAGTPEDKALTEIYATTDPAKKLQLLDNFLAEFGQGDMALVAYELYITHYMGEKNYAKVFEYGEKALALDPDSFSSALNLVRTAKETGDSAKLFAYGERIAAILQRYKAQPPPEGTDAAAWQQRKASTLADVQEDVNYVQYTLFTTGSQVQDPASRAELLERFAIAFPDSPYAAGAEMLAFAAYQQAQESPKALAFAEKVLAGNPNNYQMLLQLADYWTEKGEQLDKAEEYAKKALDVLAQAQKPGYLSDEQWQQQKSLQQGLGYSVLGQAHIEKNHNPEALEAFKTASPLLKANDYLYGRNLYRLGFTLAKMNRLPEARTVLSECVAVNSPFKAPAQEILTKLAGASHRPAKRRP
jgi:tetratricopeptide (TPR) repeat protein